MSKRRSKIYQSSSDGNLTQFNQLKRVESQVAAMSLHSKLEIDEQRGGTIFFLGIPLKEEENSDGESFGLFLKACKNCKKEIAAEEDAFMYGNLQAFCSSKCRGEQIALDQRRSGSSSADAAVARGRDHVQKLIGTAAKKFPPLNFKIVRPN